jgi:protocatechuate 3,4-dioxygenase beta subunit
MMSASAAALPGAATDDSGGYALKALLPGDLMVRAAMPGQEERMDAGKKPSFARLTLAAGERRDGVDLTIGRNDLVIAGTVTDDKGHPVTGAVVSAGAEFFRGVAGGAGHRNIITGGDGRFVIEGLSDDTYTVWAAHPAFPTATHKAVRAGERNLVVALKAPAVLAGRVVATDGAPVPAYDILLLPAARPGESIDEQDSRLWGVGSQRQSVDDPTGAFQFRGLEAGRYDLSVTTADRRAGTLSGIAVADGGSRRDLRLTVRGSAALKGRVIEYGSGMPIPSAQIVAQGAGLDLQTTADQAGRFELVGVPMGQLTSLFVHSYWETHVRENQEITVPPEGGSITLPDIKLHPGKLDWAAPDAGFTGMSPVTRDGRPVVRALRPGQPAEAAGVKVGDYILAIDGKSTADACASTVDFWMRGSAGAPLTVNVQTPGSNPRDITFVRAGR